MQRSVTWLAWLAVLLLVANAGVVDARGNAPLEAGGKKDAPPGQEKKEPAPPPAQEPAPSPQPEPAPAPDPEPAPAPVHAPPAAEAPATSPAPRPEPEPTVDAPASAADLAPASDAARRDTLPEDPLPEAPAPVPAVETAPRVAGGPVDDPLETAVVPLPFASPQESGLQGAAPLSPEAGGVSLLWGIPLAGLVLLGIVASSGRLVQPRPLPRAAPARAPPAAAPAASAQAPLVVAVKPRDIESILRAAKLAVEAFRYEDAVRLFDQALRLNPKLAVAHFCRGVCLRGLERETEACAAFRRAHELDPGEGAYRLELARACARLGRASEAMDVLGPLLHALPELVDDVLRDESFAGLLDHPRFLALAGRL